MGDGLLTGHCHLKGHLFKLGLTNSPTCERCIEKDESATHILYDFEAIAYLRFRHPGHYSVELGEYQDAPESKIFLCQRVNTATSSPADDVHHYVIPLKLLLTNRFYFQQTSGIHAPVGKRKGCSLSGRSPAPIEAFMLPQWQGNTAC
jgi:hypothetical protein